MRSGHPFSTREADKYKALSIPSLHTYAYAHSLAAPAGGMAAIRGHCPTKDHSVRDSAARLLSSEIQDVLSRPARKYIQIEPKDPSTRGALMRRPRGCAIQALRAPRSQEPPSPGRLKTQTRRCIRAPGAPASNPTGLAIACGLVWPEAVCCRGSPRHGARPAHQHESHHQHTKPSRRQLDDN